MGKSQTTFNKKEREKKKRQKKKAKAERREERREQETSGKLDDMMAYVDEFGNIVDTPPEKDSKSKIKAEDIVVGVPRQEKEDLDAEHRGKVEFFNHNKGFGFIRSAGEEYFVHVNGLLDPVNDGDEVSFYLEKNPRGLAAVQVKKV